jgi:hypothetical protein
MKRIFLTGVVALMAAPASPAFACNDCVRVPEMDASAGVAAIALLVGIGALMREKMKK